MKKLISILTIGLIVLLTNCNSTTELVSITPNISIGLPKNYKILNTNSTSNQTTYDAKINQDKLTVFRVPFKGADTMSVDFIKKDFQKNVDRFVQTFDVKNASVSDTIFGKIIQKDFTFEFSRHNSIFIFFGRFLIENENFLALCYETKKPIDRGSIKSKDKFFDYTMIK